METTLLAFLRRELAPTPGRLSNVLRITVLTVLVVVIAETFRIPLPAYSAYIVFFASKEETASTTLTGLILTAAATIAVLAAMAVYMVSANEPGLRLPLMALVAFAGLFLSRVSPLGPAAFAIGFVMTVSLTLIDVMPVNAPLPATELLTRTVLWLWVVAMLPIGLVVVANLATGRDPDDLFRRALSDRLTAVGWSLQTAADDVQISRFLRSGLGDPLRYLKLAGLLRHLSPRRMAADRALVARVYEALALANEWNALAITSPVLVAGAAACGQALLSAARSLDGETTLFVNPPPRTLGQEDPAAAFLLVRLDNLVAQLPELLAIRQNIAAHDIADRRETSAVRRLLVMDAFSNPDHARFALKTTCAVLIAYVLYNLLDWPEIRTAMITCFFVTFGNVGETVHRMALRMAGAVIGGGLGLTAVIFIMPSLTTITELCLLVGAVALIAGWVATSSDRLAYAGMQMAMAFYLCILVGYGPHVDLAIARDRVVGILLGNVIVSLVFATLWPISAIAQAKAAFAQAIGRLADLCLRPSSQPNDTDIFAFDDAQTRARRLLSFDPFEPPRLKANGIAAEDADITQSLFGSVLILSRDRDGSDRVAYREALGHWLSEVGKGMTADVRLPSPPPAAPIIAGLERNATKGEGLAPWYRVLDERVRRLDGRLAPLSNLPVGQGDSGP